MYIGEIIKKYREENELSQRAFASKTSLSPSYINTLEKIYNPKTGKPYSVTTDVAVELSNAMHIKIEDLLNMLNNDQEFVVNQDSFSNYKNNKKNDSAIVFIYGTIPAGIPMECIEDIIDTEEISTDMLKGGKQFFGLKVHGDSMYPEYLEGDTLILEKAEDCESGDDCVVMVNGNDGTFKRVFKNENGIILQPLNPAYSPMIYTNEQIENLPIKIMGIVVEIRRKKKKK